MVLATDTGKAAFVHVDRGFNKLLGFANQGAAMVFGPLAKTGLLSRYAPPGFPDLFTVTNMKIDGVRSETWNAARQWHSDQSFLPVPARAWGWKSARSTVASLT